MSKAVTYQLLKPQLDVVLFEIIFPLMCFNDADDVLWREDPHEYVRKGYGKYMLIQPYFVALFFYQLGCVCHDPVFDLFW